MKNLRAPSLVRNSAARLAADFAVLILGALFAAMTARWLGANGKGVLATISVWTAVMFQVSSLGLTEAAIVRIGQRVATPQHVFSATLAALFPLAVGGAAVLLGILLLQVGFQGAQGGLVAGAVALTLIVSVLASMSACMLVAEERIIASSAVIVVGQALTLATFATLGITGTATIEGAVVAILVGTTAQLGMTAVLLRRDDVRFRVQWDTAYLRSALRYGVRAQPAIVLTSVASRLDVALVFGIAGAAQAGIYSVALTYGALVSASAFAVSHSLFPRLVRLGHEESIILVSRTLRAVVLTTSTFAIVMAALANPAITLWFGDSYSRGATAAAVLAIAAVPWSVQWVAARAEGARDRPTVLLWTFVANSMVTLVSDVWLIPTHGVLGASIGSLLGNVAGAVCAMRCSRIRVSTIVPTRRDVTEMISTARRALRAGAV